MDLLLEPLLPVFLFFGCAIVLAVGLLVVALALNPGRSNPVADVPYESGMDPVHEARRPFDVRFFLVAIAFLVFDVELLFLYPWVVALGRERAAVSDSHFTATDLPAATLPAAPPATDAMTTFPRAGFAAEHGLFFGGLVFLLLLMIGFVYDWRKGVFRWR